MVLVFHPQHLSKLQQLFILNDQFGFDVDMVEVSKICQFSENKFNGVNCGIMDQFAIAMGKLVMRFSLIQQL